MITELGDWEFDSWSRIENLLKAGGQPTPAMLAAALRRKEPKIPGVAQDHIASLLTGEIKRDRGPQALPIGEHPTFYPEYKKLGQELAMIMLILEVQNLALAKKGADFDDRVRAAIEEIAGRRNIAASTLRRRYTAALTRLMTPLPAF